VPRTLRHGRSSNIRHGQLARMSCGRILGRSMPTTAQHTCRGVMI
jgi:hypothetical protein